MSGFPIRKCPGETRRGVINGKSTKGVELRQASISVKKVQLFGGGSLVHLRFVAGGMDVVDCCFP